MPILFMFEKRIAVKNKFIIAYKAKNKEALSDKIPSGMLLISGVSIVKQFDKITTDKKAKQFKLLYIADQILWEELEKELLEIKSLETSFFGILFENYDALSIYDLQLVVNLKLNFPTLKILFEVTNKTKSSSLQSIIDIGFDGIYADRLDDTKLLLLANKLILREGEKIKPEAKKKFQKLRNKLDELDEELLKLLAKRIKAVDEISTIKHQSNLQIVQLNRWKDVLHLTLKQAKKTGIDNDSIMNIMESIHLNAIKAQAKNYRKK